MGGKQVKREGRVKIGRGGDEEAGRQQGEVGK
jgi:hypothetical protein